MKKKISITILCDTKKDDKFIKNAMIRGTHRALDNEPYFIAPPKSVDSIDVEIETIPEQKDYQI